MAIFNSFLYVYQRVRSIKPTIEPLIPRMNASAWRSPFVPSVLKSKGHRVTQLLRARLGNVLRKGQMTHETS